MCRRSVSWSITPRNGASCGNRSRSYVIEAMARSMRWWAFGSSSITTRPKTSKSGRMRRSTRSATSSQAHIS